MPDEPTTKPRRLPSASQYRTAIEDPRDLQTVSITGISVPADVRIGWFPHDDGDPLWFAECRFGDPGYFFMEYGDTRDEALQRAMASLKARGIT